MMALLVRELAKFSITGLLNTNSDLAKKQEKL